MRILFLSLLVFAFNAFSCTTFLLEDGKNRLLGKSYDWDYDHGFAFTNKRGVEKTSLNLYPGEKPASWVSKYSNVTLNQYGREFPNSGMNEKGLVVEIMWLDETAHETTDSRPSINEMQWVQYQLDNFASTSEVLLNLNKIRIRKVYGDVHYLICDKFGECATIEFVKGKPLVHTGVTLPFKALTNDTYPNSLTYLKKHEGFGGSMPFKESSAFSLDRFARAVALSQNQVASISKVFEILDTVRQANYTVWNVGYDVLNSTIYFRPTKKPSVRHFSTHFNGSCQEEVKMLDLEADLSGDVSNQFENFNASKNEKMVQKSMAGNALGKFIVPLIVGYPAKTKCKG